jgi:phage portal protein BeeE
MGIRSRIANVFLPPGAPQVDDEYRYSFNDWVNEVVQFGFNGNSYVLPLTQVGKDGERIENNFAQYVSRVFKNSGPAFAVIETRANLFAEARFQYRSLKTKDLYGDATLDLLEHPWPNGTTGELLKTMEYDASLAGNFYARIVAPAGRQPAMIRRMDPSKVKIALTSTNSQPYNDLTAVLAGYVYYPDGYDHHDTAIGLTVKEVVHWSPIPDPAAMYRGMSWLTPVIREIQSDGAATDSKQAFFDNAMTPNLAIKFPPEVATPEHFEKLRDAMQSSHGGTRNAFKTLYLAAGADVTVVGADLKTSGMRDVQGADETRICAAGRVPPVIVGLSEGLQAATYSNYGQARRQFADGWARPQWRSACSALAKAVQVPAGSELWYDDRGIAFLREDAKEAADTIVTHATAVVTLVNGGFTADSAVKAVQAGDLSLLSHTDLVSVQLQAPGTVVSAPGVPVLTSN